MVQRLSRMMRRTFSRLTVRLMPAHQLHYRQMVGESEYRHYLDVKLEEVE